MRFVFDLIIKKPDNFYNVVWFFPFNKAWTNDLLGMKIEPFKKKLTHSKLPQFDTIISRMLTYSQDFITLKIGFTGK